MFVFWNLDVYVSSVTLCSALARLQQCDSPENRQLGSFPIRVENNRAAVVTTELGKQLLIVM